MIQIAPGNGFLGGVVDIHNHTISLRESDGRLVKMDLGTADVHVDAAMQNYITGYKPADMIADAVKPGDANYTLLLRLTRKLQAHIRRA